MAATLPLVTEDSGGSRPPLALPPGILDVPVEALRAWLAERGQPPMRVNQIRKQVLANRAIAFGEMTDLPKELRAELAAAFAVFSTRVERHLVASDGTHKLLLRLHDDRMIECVLIQDEGRATACISTQVGCGMGCVFCASGLNGVVRNLTVGEIVEQLVRLRNLVGSDQTSRASDGTGSAARLTHIVVMGMGEPLANLDNLLAALAVAGDKNGLGIGQRHITISTVGLPAKIRRLADLGKQYHLAVSLHAPNDALRTRIVPTNDKTGLPAILDAADYFYEKTGRQVTYEYVVLGGLNDGADARGRTRSAARGSQGSRQPDSVERRGGAAVSPAGGRRTCTGFIDTLRRAGRQREGSQAKGLRDRRRVRAAPPASGTRSRTGVRR